MAITYTTNLTLPVVDDDELNWGAAYRTMMEKLDRNPGIRIAADEAAMVALTTFPGRMCWREDLSKYWFYDGTQWSEVPGQDVSVVGGGMQDTAQKATSSIAASGVGTGTIDFLYYPGTGQEIMLLMLQVLPWAAFASITDEAVVLSGMTEMRLTQKMAREVEVVNIIVKKDDFEVPVTVTEEPQTLEGTTPVRLDEKNYNGTEVSVTAVTLDDLGKTPCTKDVDYELSVDGEGYTTIARKDDVAEVQSLYLGGADGGTFTLGNGITDTDPIAYNASAATIQSELEAIYGIGNVEVADNGDFLIVFDKSVKDSGLEANFASLDNAVDPALAVDTAYYTSLIEDPGDVLITYDYLPPQTVYVRDVDYEITVDSSGTNIARLGGGSIGDGGTVLVDYNYQPGVDGFKFQLLSKAGGEVLYELDTSQDPDWDAGHAVRDPNFGYLPMCYYKNEDDEPVLRYRIENLDTALASAFLIDCKYKPLT